MTGQGTTEPILDAQKPATEESVDPKCGCCLETMKLLKPGEAHLKGYIVDRPCRCHQIKTCYICSWCLDHCKCGQRFVVD